MHTVSLTDIQPGPWRNGGGMTRELLTWPLNAPDWQLRLTLAEITRDGPSSDFPGVDRWFSVATGNGVVMTFAHDQVWLAPGSDPLCFDGGAASDCDLHEGPVRAFNFMVAQAAGRGSMQRLQPGMMWGSRARWRAAFVLDPARLTVGDGAAHELADGTLIWTDQADGENWRITATDGDDADVRGWWMEYFSVPIA